MSLEESGEVTETAESAIEMEPTPQTQCTATASARIFVLGVSPAKIRSIVIRWNRQWIGGDRFAREYADAVMSFDAEVTQAVSRRPPAKYCPAAMELETHAAVWAAVLVAFEAASFREPDREILLAALLGELRARWSPGESSYLFHEAGIFERALDYFALRDGGSQLKTATQIVNSYLLSVGLPEKAGSSALARHLAAIFGHHILRNLYRLSAASRLRTAAVSLVERQKTRSG